MVGGVFRVDFAAAVVGEHVDEVGMGSDGAGAYEVESVSIGGGAGFVVEVVEDFDVVAKEADRGRDNGIDAFAKAFVDEGVDVGLRPGDGGIGGSALVGEIEDVSTEFLSRQSGRAPKLTGVGRGSSGGLRYTVRGENERGFIEFRGTEIFAFLANAFDNGGDEAFVTEPRRKVVDGGFLSSKVFDGFGNSLPVPVPTDFGLVGRHNDCENVAVSVFHHARNDLADVWRPVTEPGVDGDIDASLGERGSERFGLFHRQFVKGGESAELGVVGRDLFDTVGFCGGVSKYPLDETEGFAGAGGVFAAAPGRGPAEGDEEYGIKFVLGHGEKQFLVILASLRTS